MGKSDPVEPNAPRRRTLNIIYFVDSSKTRALKIPVGRARGVLCGATALVVWAVGSAFLLAAAYKDNDALTLSLRASMATIFEYETRYDGVYEVAYPGQGGETQRVSEPVAKAGESRTARAAADVAAAASAARQQQEVATKAVPPAPVAKVESGKTEVEVAAVKEPEATQESVPESSVKLAAKTPPQIEASATGGDAAVSVGNPVIQAEKDGLQLNFDLTNKSENRAEGYIWAVAEFRTQQGDVSYIADPPAIGVKADGEPTELAKSSNFGIRRFKKMSFSFPIAKEQSGTFTGIKIGVTDKTGMRRMTYNVPVEIKVGPETR